MAQERTVGLVFLQGDTGRPVFQAVKVKAKVKLSFQETGNTWTMEYPVCRGVGTE